VFDGIDCQLTLINLPQSITPVYLHPAPKPVTSYVVGAANSTIKDVFSTHVMTGVDKLHADGVYGKGITVGIIDTGIDYTHPALGGKVGAGNKVIGGYDFVGDAYTGREGTPAPAPDNDVSRLTKFSHPANPNSTSSPSISVTATVPT
jgi:hypothetical protein